MYWKRPLQKQHAMSGVASTPYSRRMDVISDDEPHATPESAAWSVAHVWESDGG